MCKNLMMRDNSNSNSSSAGELITAEAARAMLNPSESPEDLAIAQLTDRIQNAIKTACLQRQTSTLVDVPDWLHGIPIFDRRIVRSVLKSVYRKLGYRLMSTSENSFLISWGMDSRSMTPTSSGQSRTGPVTPSQQRSEHNRSASTNNRSASTNNRSASTNNRSTISSSTGRSSSPLVTQRRPELTYPSPPKLQLPTAREVITVVTDDKRKDSSCGALQVKLLKS